MIESHDFPNIMELVDKLVPITNQYVIDDVAMASFCLSVCVNNRSALESLLALNWALANHNCSGEKRIDTYGDFSNFYAEIADIMKPNPYMDYIEEDFGEVKIDVFGHTYPIIVGTGHNLVFACLQFLPYLAQELDKTEELIDVLSYSSDIIDYLQKANTSDDKKEIRFVLPGKELFRKVKVLYERLLSENLENIAKLVESNIIEKMHFVSKNETIFPLFNTSIMLDLYDKWYKELSELQKVQLVNSALAGIALSLSKLERENNISIMCPVARTEEQNANKQLENYPFVVMSRKGIIFAINSGEYNEAEIETLYKTIVSSQEAGSLFLAELISRSSDKKLRGVTIKKDTPVKFLVIDDWANPEEDYASFGERDDKHLHCTALDAVYYLLFMHDADELFDYICYKTDDDKAKTIGFGGDSSRFLIWQQSGHMLEKGALKYGFIDLGYNTENEQVVDYFKNELEFFPFGENDYILDNPFSWNIQKLEKGFYQFVLKGGNGFGGLFYPLSCGSYFFFPYNVSFFNGIKEYMEYKDIIPIIEDIIKRMLTSLRDIIDESYGEEKYAIQIMMMPYSYAEKVGMSEKLSDSSRKYAYSDHNNTDGKIIIRYVPIISNIFEGIKNSETRSAEADIFLEIISPLKYAAPNLYMRISDRVQQIRLERKEISVSTFQIEYKWNREDESDFIINDDAYHKVRKHIAILCYEAGVKPGVYYGNEATSVVRSIQKRLISDFEDEVCRFDYMKLYEKALSIYATLVHTVMIHRKRYENIGDVKASVKAEVADEIIKQREEAKHNAKVALYLLETVMYLGVKGTEELTGEMLQYLLAYANWLVVLSDDADMCHFTEKEVCVEVSSEYLIDVDTNTGWRTSALDELPKRMYDNPGYIERDYDEDNRCFENVKAKFEIDTDISLAHFLSFLYYLETGGSIGKELSFKNNVLCFWEDDILKDYSDVEKIKLLEAKKILNYTIIHPEKLKTKNGKSDYYLPIGEKEKRDNRFEVKPVYTYDGMIIYSPSVIHFLRLYWENSLFDFCMPYEIGLPETKEALDEWKRVYEKRIVFDLEKVLRERGFRVWHNFELKKLKRGKYPDYLGDYDVFAVNVERNEIWIVECKVLEKVETFYEMFRQQKRFFEEDKSDEKFQRRIDFLNGNYMDVVSDLSLPSGEYSIRPYMCVNKVFASRYKEVAFPILSYRELVSLINEEK